MNVASLAFGGLSGTAVLIIAVIIIVGLILLGVYFWGRSSKDNPNTNKVPKENKELTEEQNERLKSLAQLMHKDMDGINLSWDEDLYRTALNLPNSELVALYNWFNSMYEVGSGETLIDWLKSEQFHWDSWSLQSDVNKLIDKMKGLNLI